MTKFSIYKNKGVWHNCSNGQVVAPSVLKDHGHKVTDKQRHAYDVETAKFIDDYRKARSNMSEEAKAEEAYERRAAFGPGVEVIDCLTGERYKT